MEQVNTFIPNKKLLVLDGAANHFMGGTLFPNVILGDFDSILNAEYWGIQNQFDSIDNCTKPYPGYFGVLIVPAKNQDFTDLEKGIHFCDSSLADSIVILNATGGRLDHTLGNIGFLKKYYRPDRKITLVTRTECVEYVKDATVMLTGPVGSVCAILGYPEAKMTTTGLTYNGQNYPLSIGLQESICNTLAEPTATINIQGEALVISCIPHE
ncbi:MAG: thiamine diphosphokinase [Parachlamydiales bacterium]|jgi:thiamine pyrophosphokinase